MDVQSSDVEESEGEDNNLAPSGAAEPVQSPGVGGGGNREDGGRGREGANPDAVYPGRHGDDEEAEDSLCPDTAAFFAIETQINCKSAFHGFKKSTQRYQAVRFANADCCNVWQQYTATRFTRAYRR